jgi:hypothetical protein
MSKKDKELRPFFANFLEGLDEEEQNQLMAGGQTKKYPSDKEELWDMEDM